MLPEKFKERMKQMLGGEYEPFLSALLQERYQALRVNPLKADAKEVCSRVPFCRGAVSWAADAFYYEASDQPGKHPYHEAGVYYIQEPSAMAPVSFLGARPGEKILDLCAAPGGKSTQIAADMQGKGMLVCNEIHPARAKILSENIERMGIRNALVLNEAPERLAGRFAGYFDRILVDAPCSGEGMFRKNEAACEEWSPENVRRCAERQDLILECAYHMLRPGGRLCYSTCTFAPAENEGSVARLLGRHGDLHVERCDLPEGFRPGRKEWAVWEENAGEGGSAVRTDGVEYTMRLWPHLIRGEGHFIAVIHKEGACEPGMAGIRRQDGEKGIKEKDCQEFCAFREQYLNLPTDGILLRFGEQLYLAPEELPSLKGLKVLRPGLHLGSLKKNRFEPSHALALALRKENAMLSCSLDADGEELRSYLNGESLRMEGEKGWYLICADDYSIGWGKWAGGMMKNHYPKGLRKNWK